jgi:tetratricopeptide (TPR) repeat protein
MTAENRERTRVLGLFHGAVDLDVLRLMMEWEEKEVVALAVELVETGLATPNPYSHLTLNPALCPYLRAQLDAVEREALTARWVEAMRQYAEFLRQQQSRNAELAATLTLLELPNIFALLDSVQRVGDVEATINLATSLYSLLQYTGRPRLVERVGQVRDAAAASLGEAWNQARFEAARTYIEQQFASGWLREAFNGAQTLLQRARAAGEQAYPNADYDLALACLLFARVLTTAGGSEQALPLLEEARQRFEAVAKERPGRGAERMASACITEQADCLRSLGRLDEEALAYEEAIRRDEQRGDHRDVGIGKIQLGTVRVYQRRYSEALAMYAEARERFTQLDEPGTVAVTWHQTGMAYQDAGQPEAAEDAYRKSLAIEVRLGNVAGQAASLVQLGNLYDDELNRPEEAVAFYRQAVDKSVESSDVAKEGRRRSNLAATLRKLRRLDEARQEILRAIQCKAQFGHASEPWKSWSILADIETDAGNASPAAEANRQAIASYLAFRRDGGENHTTPGRLFHAVTQALRAGQKARAEQIIAEYRERWKDYKTPEADALESILAGSRDRTLADNPELSYTMAAEILFLIETLESNK